jgi:hypothetical protein
LESVLVGGLIGLLADQSHNNQSCGTRDACIEAVDHPVVRLPAGVLARGVVGLFAVSRS